MEEIIKEIIYLNQDFSEEEKEVLREYAGDNYEVLAYIKGDSYVLNNKGQYSYNACFTPTEKELFAKQRYEKVIPYRIIKFYDFYLMNMQGDSEWFRGWSHENGNWEYWCYCDSLAEAFAGL